MPSRRRPPDSQLRAIVGRVLKNNASDSDVPVIISTLDGEYSAAVGHLLNRDGARISALVDVAMERDRAVTVFLPENAYLGEILGCAEQGKQFSIELNLIQYRNAAE